jgi:hypothetical protein
VHIEEELYAIASEYVRVADPSVKELVIVQAIKAGLRHMSDYTGFVIGLSRYVTTIPTGTQEFLIPQRGARSIRLIGTNNRLLKTFPDGTRSIRLSKFAQEDCNSSKGLTVSYEAGAGCLNDLPASAVQGILKYVAHIYENRGDQNQLNLRGLNDSLSRSGALSEWRNYTTKVA